MTHEISTERPDDSRQNFLAMSGLGAATALAAATRVNLKSLKGNKMKPTTIAYALLALTLAGPLYAEGDLSRANVIDVVIEMGTSDDGRMYLKPDHYEFVTGQAYKLILTNVDEIVHELALNEMGEQIFTRKIEIADDKGDLVAEIKGNIREVEVGPGKVVEWFIVPIQTTKDPIEITCEIPGHLEAGMRASVMIK